jgi:hypothetical protein
VNGHPFRIEHERSFESVLAGDKDARQDRAGDAAPDKTAPVDPHFHCDPPAAG